ncbi:Restriction endonuclease [Pseudomonas sp. IT-196MI5]|uniref:hypothetical protein n=1 Tax=Pseudomonas sp. IT-196MI5 TaxID=3026440 RepID=UPI0039DF9F90
MTRKLVPTGSTKEIYLEKMTECSMRLRASEAFLKNFQVSGSPPEADAAILQLRKSLEAIAFASIAPHKARYEEFRSRCEDQPDFTKDYRATKILQVLSKINSDFYPTPLIPAVRQPDGSWYFDLKTEGVLSKKRFVKIYDRLGRHLHSANLWSSQDGFDSLISELSNVINESFALIETHMTTIQTPEFSGVWVVKVPREGVPELITGEAQGEFCVSNK